ncbi:alpha/beta-hydrolase [Panus rudis PR-1116 ss-1]|nr:alpha/beta-hydrolase [Panus rudis PR-1116 ss-1]
MSFCKDCTSGVIHEGNPEGKIELVGGVRCYVATPTVDYPKDKVLIYLIDIFGIDFINAQLLADAFARHGFKTIMPDIIDNDPTPLDALDPDTTFDLSAWLPKHDASSYLPILHKVFAGFKEDGVTKFAASGYCYGARPAFDLAFEDKLDVTIISHPSLLRYPDDIETYKAKSKAPLLINAAEIDDAFPAPARRQTVDILGDGKFAPGFELKLWEGCRHGFVVRGDYSDPKVKAGREGAFKASVEFLNKHL